MDSRRCVPSAAVVVSRGGGGVSAPGGVCSRGGVCSWGVSARGGVCSRGVSARDGSAPGGGVSVLGGGIPACTEADTPRVDRHTPVKT